MPEEDVSTEIQQQEGWLLLPIQLTLQESIDDDATAHRYVDGGSAASAYLHKWERRVGLIPCRMQHLLDMEHHVNTGHLEEARHVSLVT